MDEDDSRIGITARQRAWWQAHNLRAIPLGELITATEDEEDPSLFSRRKPMASLREIVAAKTDLALPPPMDDRFPPSNGVEQPMSPMAAGYLPRLKSVVHDLNLKILVVGCLPGNLGPKWWNHPRVELWSSQDEAKWQRQSIPRDVGALLLLEWISHPASKRVLREAKERDLVYTPVPIGTGDVRQLLAEAFKGYAEPAKARQSEIWDQRGDLRRQQLHAQQAETLARAMEAATRSDGQQPAVVPPPAPPPQPSTPTPTQPAEPDPLPAPAPQAPPPTTQRGRGPDRNKRLRGLSEVILAVGGRPEAIPHTKEAKRIVKAVQATFPSVNFKQLATQLNSMRHRGLKGLKSGEVPPAPVAPAPVAPAPVAPVAKAPPKRQKEPQASSAPAADISIDQALDALASAEKAINKAVEALLTARSQMADTVVKEVEAALAGVLARYRK